MIAEVIASMDAALAPLRTAMQELGPLDPVSQDVAIEVSRALDKDRWLLYAHISA